MENSLFVEVAKLLVEKKITIATAESCTGGKIAAGLVSYPGVSDSFLGGFVTYANSVKEKVLNVSPETLENYGAVSFETAREMAEGARVLASSDVAVSTTGIAGPGGGTEKKPVGLVYIGYSDKNITESFEFHFEGTREEVRNQATETALRIVKEKIDG